MGGLQWGICDHRDRPAVQDGSNISPPAPSPSTIAGPHDRNCFGHHEDERIGGLQDASAIHSTPTSLASKEVWERLRANSEVELLFETVEAVARAEEPRFQPEIIAQEAKQLQCKLKELALNERPIVGDGACQFRAVADQIYEDQELHQQVRHTAVSHLRARRRQYEQFVDGSFDDYITRMQEADCWGDNLTLQATSDAYDIEVCCLTTYKTKSFIRISPQSKKPTQQIWLGFYSEYHYTSIVANT